MSRARNIKPGFFKNDELGECSIYARVLFAGLWCEADPRGILEDRPKRLKIEILPYDDVDADSLLADLEAHGFIRRYQVGGVRCIKVVNFEKHQNPHQNEKNNELPDLPRDDSESDAASAPEDSGAIPVQAREQHQSNPADSFNMNPDSLITDPGFPEEQTNGRSSPKKRRSPSGSRADPDADAIEADFEARFYGPYPRHVKREDALRAWRNLKPTDRNAAATALQAWLEASAFAPDVQFVPYPASWLNGKRWNDDISAAGRSSPPKPKTERDVAAERIAYLESGPAQWSVADRDRYKGEAGRAMLERDLAVYRRVLDGAAA